MNSVVVREIVGLLLLVLIVTVSSFIAIRSAKTDYGQEWHKKELKELLEAFGLLVLIYLSFVLVWWFLIQAFSGS